MTPPPGRLVALAAFLVALSCAARAQLPSPYPTDAAGHIFRQEPGGVLSANLPAEATQHIGEISKFFARFAQEVTDNQKAEDSGQEDTGSVATATCNMQDSDWGSRAKDYVVTHGLKEPQTDKKGCPTMREVRDNPSRKLFYPELERHLPKFAALLNASAAAIAGKAGRNWGANAAGVSRFWYPDRENQNCTLWHTMAIRSNNAWHVQARITADNDTNAGIVGSDNDYIIEHVRVTNGRLVPLRLQVPLDKDASTFGNATTTFEVWSRPAPDSVSVNADISRNLAFRAALADGENWHQQAQDAAQVSNTAILLLPLAMNLVPVALIADVNTFGMLLYTALTDVLTTVPLCIKGIELINIANLRFTATSAQITGRLAPGETAVAEAWVAQCRLKAHDEHMRRGVVFVVLSLGLMIFGVACEFIARRWVAKKRAEQQIPVTCGVDGEPDGGGGGAYGTSTSYQPFTAAALTLQNRLPSRSGGVARTTNAGVAAGGMDMHDVTPAHAHGHHGGNCLCACHSQQHGGAVGPEYDSRPYPDPLARKYH